jgi:hypothetical protein
MNSNDWIFNVVTSFYSKATSDILIGYHFRNIVDFEDHIPRIVTFWEMQLLGKSSQKTDTPFDIINAHIPLKIKRGELGRWLLLFRQTLDQQEALSPEMGELKQEWERRLEIFEGIFSRFFRL